MTMLPWLADVLRGGGLPVREVPGWQTRGHGAMGQVAGVLCHHTAGAASGSGRLGSLVVDGYPSLATVVNGRAGLAGPLANLGLARDGTWVVIAAGQAWHAGTGALPWCPAGQGNTRLIGVEAESVGTRDDWTSQQRASYPHGVAVLLRHLGLGADRCAGHKEWAPTRKIDPAYWDMNDFRSSVAAWLAMPNTLDPTKRKETAVLRSVQVHGQGSHREGLPVGSASAIYTRAWVSLLADGGTGAKAKLFFQDDRGGKSDADLAAVFRDGWSSRDWRQAPDGTTQVNVVYDAPDGAVIVFEAEPR